MIAAILLYAVGAVAAALLIEASERQNTEQRFPAFELFAVVLWPIFLGRVVGGTLRELWKMRGFWRRP